MASSSTTFSPILYFTKSHKKWNSLFHTTPSHFAKSQKNGTHYSIQRLPISISQKVIIKLPIKSLDIVEENGVKANQVPLQKKIEDALKAFKALKKPTMVVVLMCLSVMYDPHKALAASEGRVGGNSFSSWSSESSNFYSALNIGGGDSTRFDSKILTLDSSSQTSRSSTRYDSFTEVVGTSFTPYLDPLQFGGGEVYVAPIVGFGSRLFFIVISFLAFIFVSGILSNLFVGSEDVLGVNHKTTIVKLQVGLLGMARSLRIDLNRIVEVANTSSLEGLHFLLTSKKF